MVPLEVLITTCVIHSDLCLPLQLKQYKPKSTSLQNLRGSYPLVKGFDSQASASSCHVGISVRAHVIYLIDAVLI